MAGRDSMDDNAEEGILRAQLKNKQGLEKRQSWGIAYVNERILIYLFALALLGLAVVWATATTAWVLYGSFAGVVAITILWGYARIKRIELERLERQRQVEASQANDDGGV